MNCLKFNWVLNYPKTKQPTHRKTTRRKTKQPTHPPAFYFFTLRKI